MNLVSGLFCFASIMFLIALAVELLSGKDTFESLVLSLLCFIVAVVTKKEAKNEFIGKN